MYESFDGTLCYFLKKLYNYDNWHTATDSFEI